MPTKKAQPQRPVRDDESIRQAEEAYTEAMGAFVRHDWAGAAAKFDALLKAHGDVRDIPDYLDRARMHRAACQRHLDLAGPLALPKDADAWLLHGVALSNQRSYDEALEALGKALALGGHAGRIHFVRAGALTQAERTTEALEALAEAFAADSMQRIYAATDPDLAPLRELHEYSELIDPPLSGGDD